MSSMRGVRGFVMADMNVGERDKNLEMILMDAKQYKIVKPGDRVAVASALNEETAEEQNHFKVITI